MGRKTFESIGRPLPNRLNIVMSRDASYEPDGVTMVSTMEEAIAVAGDAEEVMVIGGATIYEQTCRDADALELTVVHKKIEGDAFFPDFVSLGEWILKRMTFCEPDEDNPLPMTFMRLEKIQKV
jgi:dihydrofolate reductase